MIIKIMPVLRPDFGNFVAPEKLGIRVIAHPAAEWGAGRERLAANSDRRLTGRAS